MSGGGGEARGGGAPERRQELQLYLAGQPTKEESSVAAARVRGVNSQVFVAGVGMLLLHVCFVAPHRGPPPAPWAQRAQRSAPSST